MDLSAKHLEQSFAETSKKVEVYEKFIKKNLKENVDYGVASEHKGSKPTLLKPGAEKLCLLLNARPEFKRDDDSLTHLKQDIKEETISYICYLVSRSDGKIIGEGRGSSSVYKMQNQKPVLDVNRAIKMAEKRAQMDAVLRVAALSGRFTQDMEDEEYQPIHQQRQPTARPKPNGYNQGTDKNFPATKAQMNCIARHLNEMTEEERAQFTQLTTERGISAKSLTKKQASFVIDEIMKIKRNRQSTQSPKNDDRKVFDPRPENPPSNAKVVLTADDERDIVDTIHNLATIEDIDSYMSKIWAYAMTPIQRRTFSDAAIHAKQSLRP